jgi:YidC/Oxa1 family membrane protein insertase
MNYFIVFYHVIFKYPILNLLIFFYQTIGLHDLGLAIIFVTLAIRLILYPFFHTGAKQQMLMQRIQPHVKKIQEQHKDDREKQAQALMALYKEHGVNPFSSILLLIIQLPILIALYRIILYELAGTAALTGLYSFVHAPMSINAMFLGLINLQAKNIWMVLAAAAGQFVQARLAIWRNPNAGSTPSAAEKMARQMAFVAPVITIVIFYGLPAAVGLYWLTSSIFSILQQAIVNRHLRRKFGN